MAKLVKSIYTGSDVTSLGELTSSDSIEDNYKWSGSQRATFPEVITTVVGIDLDAAQNFKITPSGDQTLTFTNEVSGQSGFIWLVNTTPRTISQGSNVLMDDNILDTINAEGTYLLSYICDGTDTIVTNSASVS